MRGGRSPPRPLLRNWKRPPQGPWGGFCGRALERNSGSGGRKAPARPETLASFRLPPPPGRLPIAREAAEETYRAAAGARVLTSRGDLESFFDRCDATEVGREPDWAVHRRVIEESIAAGNPPIAAPDRPKRGQ
jgi:hypothetical protein